MTIPKCPECGGTDWYRRDNERLERENAHLQQKYRNMTYQYANAKANNDIMEYRYQEETKGLRRKIDAQRKAIKKLEEKFRAKGLRPYEEEAKSD